MASTVWQLTGSAPELPRLTYGGAHIHDSRAYLLTGRDDYLQQARRWAITGVPFVYLWSDQPVMRYATTPVLGATNWKAPLWIAKPVQWCGIVYAHAIAKLDHHDDTLD